MAKSNRHMMTSLLVINTERGYGRNASAKPLSTLTSTGRSSGGGEENPY